MLESKILCLILVEAQLSTASIAAAAGKNSDGSLILHIDPTTKKLVAKEQALMDKQQASLKPCELRFQDLACHMVPLTCR